MLYAGVGGSNANYGDASGEFDVYLGLTKDFGSMSLDLGAVHYDYPGNSSNNTEDVYVIAGFGSVKLVFTKQPLQIGLELIMEQAPHTPMVHIHSH